MSFAVTIWLFFLKEVSKHSYSIVRTLMVMYVGQGIDYGGHQYQGRVYNYVGDLQA